jgi:hypothetical protein
MTERASWQKLVIRKDFGTSSVSGKFELFLAEFAPHEMLPSSDS